jgi:tetratricopeptide (TPR) repeat protein
VAAGAAGRPSARNAQALHMRAHESLSRGACDEALECYRELVSLDPRDAAARNGLGLVLLRLGRLNEAQEQFRRAIGIRDGYPEAHFQQFPPSLSFTMNLADLADYYREHRRLVEHWRSVLPPETLLDVPYAELIAEQEKWTRRILDFLGLPWELTGND